MIKHIIWDAGGTLFNTYPAMVKALDSTLKRKDLEVDVEEIKRLIRVSRQHAFNVLSERYSLDAKILEADYKAAYAEIDSELQPVFPGVLPIIEHIRKNGGSNYIVTHRSREGVQKLFDAHGLHGLFETIITSDDDFPRKPDPSSIKHVLKTNNLNRDNVLVVGDRIIDIQAGKRAGVCTCMYTQTDDDSGADFVISDYMNLLHQLERRTVPC